MNPTTGRMLWRGCRKRCPYCGAGHLFSAWIKMRPRCPRCGYRFAREEGWWLGAYVINFAATEAVVAVLLAAVIAIEAGGGSVRPLPAILAGTAAVVVVPFLFFPFSRTIWAAIDLAMHPLEMRELVEAAAAEWSGDDGATNDD